MNTINNYVTKQQTHITPINSSYIIGDNGASGSFFKIDDIKFLTNIKKHNIDSKAISVKLPNNDIMTSTHSAELNIDGLSQSARTVHLFPNLHSSLLGFGPLCDDGCIITLNRTTVTVVKNNTVVMTGNRDGPGKLWMMDLSRSQPHSSSIQQQQINNANIVVNSELNENSKNVFISNTNNEISNFSELTAAVDIPLLQSKKVQNVNLMPEIISSSIERILCFYHGTFGSLPISTFRKAIQKKFISFPGITVDHVNKYLRHSVYTDRGHMRRIRQGMNSTKTNQFYDCNDILQPIPTTTKRQHRILVHMMPATHRLHFDATGKFNYSDSTYDYDLIFYCEDANYIHAEKMNGLTKNDYVNAITAGLTFFNNKSIKSEVVRLDNQISDLVAHLLKITNQLTIEIVPPDSHRGLKAERARFRRGKTIRFLFSLLPMNHVRVVLLNTLIVM